MPKRTLTAAAVERLKPPKSGQEEHFDAGFPGLALRISYGGTRSWTYHYRSRGRQRRLTLGVYPAVSLAEAREKWRQARQEVDRGGDPAQAKVEAKATLPETVSEVGAEFFRRYARPRNRTADEIERMFDQHVYPVIGDLHMETVNRRDILRLLDRAEANGATIRVNRILTNVKRLFSWAEERGYIGSSPATGIKPPIKEVARDRVLSDNEIHALLKSCDKLGDPFGPIFKLLLLTGQRRTEISGASWFEVDLESAKLNIPANRVKNGRAHSVPLSGSAVEVLRTIPRHAGTNLVFPSRFSRTGSKGQRPVSGFTKGKQRLDGLMLKELQTVAAERGEDVTLVKLPEWRIHDLRRTAASGMARVGTPVHVVEKALNHISGSLGGIAGVYNRHDYKDEMRRAMNAWADFLDGMSAKKNDPVVYLSEARR